jgi:lipid A 4'-phosphatase
VLVALVFIAWPGLDLKAAALFALGGNRFAGQTPLGEAARRIFNDAPFVLLAGMALLYGLRRWGGVRVWAPNGAGVAFMALSLALGPGLLVNGVLKNHSHRPRPYQVVDFGGDAVFRPFYRTDGACRSNCSFVSGEGSAAFWTLAPALLAPPAWRPVAVAAGLLFGVATSLLRMAFGGHFLSDCIFAALLTWLVILGCWRLVARLGRSTPDGVAA